MFFYLGCDEFGISSTTTRVATWTRTFCGGHLASCRMYRCRLASIPLRHSYRRRARGLPLLLVGLRLGESLHGPPELRVGDQPLKEAQRHCFPCWRPSSMSPSPAPCWCSPSASAAKMAMRGSIPVASNRQETSVGVQNRLAVPS
jgi:hypothetical protein